MSAHDDIGRFETEYPFVARADANRLRSRCADVLLFAAVVLIALPVISWAASTLADVIGGGS